MSLTPKLVVIRGPAGAGKSSTSQVVLEFLKSFDKTGKVAILEQDYFNNVITGRQSGYRDLTIQLMLQSGLACQQQNYSLVIEGVLNSIYFKNMLDQLATAYGEGNVMFYYCDVSLEETKRRHLQRQKSQEFGVDLLDEWFSAASPMGYVNEIILPQSNSIDENRDIIVSNYLKTHHED